MSRWNAYLNNLEEIVGKYDGAMPLSHWLKAYFRERKKMGSTDRKIVSSIAYQYYRSFHALSALPFRDHVLAARLLCTDQPEPLLEALRPEWNEAVTLSTELKEALIREAFPSQIHASVRMNKGQQGSDLPEVGPGPPDHFNYFPFTSSLSTGIDHEAFARSFLVQPDLFLRLRPGHQFAVKDKLLQARISFHEHGEDCISLANQSQLEGIIRLDQEAVIQDYNSQRVGDFFDLEQMGTRLKVWDCCAASGGKSIMAFDQNPAIELTVSDVRKTILENLADRFRAAGILKYRSFKADLTNGPGTLLGSGKLVEGSEKLVEGTGKVVEGSGKLVEGTGKVAKPAKQPNEKYDIIIADLPCSGSGTWSRTPEQLAFFKTAQITYYSKLQKSILRNVVPALKNNGRIVYITCSVFKAENEEVVAFAIEELGLKLLEMKLLKGYQMKADSLFVAVFRRI